MKAVIIRYGLWSWVAFALLSFIALYLLSIANQIVSWRIVMGAAVLAVLATRLESFGEWLVMTVILLPVAGVMFFVWDIIRDFSWAIAVPLFWLFGSSPTPAHHENESGRSPSKQKD